MKKEDNFSYKFVRDVFGPVWNFYYNAKVVGQENIPEEGSIVVVGNHIHIMDQCPAILSTKRMLHYMAKKEYFDGKFAWFFKACGCIPVNRSIHDDSAKSAAMDVLNSDFALGLFPEGTRNGLKPEKMKEVSEFCGLEFDKKQMKILKNQRTSQINFLMELEVDNLIYSENNTMFIDVKKWDKVYQSWMDIFRNWIANNKDNLLQNLNEIYEKFYIFISFSLVPIKKNALLRMLEKCKPKRTYDSADAF